MIFNKFSLFRKERSGYGGKEILVREFYDENIAKLYMNNLALSYINQGYTKAKSDAAPENGILLAKIGDQVEFVLTSSEIDDSGAPWNKEISDDRG